MRYSTLFLALWLKHAATAQNPNVPDWLKAYDVNPPQQCIADPAGPLSAAQTHGMCAPAVDDETALRTRAWRPWTFPPVCVQAQPEEQQEGDGVEAAGPKLCVYTYAGLRGEASISIVTTPENAAAGVGVGVLGDADARWEGWARGGSGGQGGPLLVADPPPYEIRDLALEGKGLGVLANRTIRRGEVVMLRYPVLLLVSYQGLWRQGDVLRLLHRAAVQLPPLQSMQMLQLARSKGGYVVDDIVNTNAFGVLLAGVEHSGLYLDVSRLNHACKPNMFSRFSPTTLGMEVVAYRDIEPGEELTFSYLPLNLLSEQRQSLIREWGFNCTCSLCSSRHESTVSDRRRSRIQDLLAELDRPELRNHEAVEKRIAEILNLCEKESLEAQVGDFCTIVAEVYSSMGDVDLARRYGELAVKELRHFAGYDHDRTKDAALFLKSLDRKID
ncbi:SET domain-containing protein [Hypoxylon sp. NC1633]|nr:SET domain-containing protein [Hypoxylon sp. NC1633]